MVFFEYGHTGPLQVPGIRGDFLFFSATTFSQSSSLPTMIVAHGPMVETSSDLFSSAVAVLVPAPRPRNALAVRLKQYCGVDAHFLGSVASSWRE